MSKIYNYENFIFEHSTRLGTFLQLESEYKKLLKDDPNNPELEVVCDKICKLLYLRNYQIVKGIVNVEDTVMLDSRSLHGSKKIQTIPVKFGIIEGSFFCDRNALISLDGSPKQVSQTFDCHMNDLTTLTGCPEIIGSDFHCGENLLTSLVDGPKSVNGFYSFSNNHIYELTGFCEHFDGEVFFHNNPVEEVLDLFGETGDKLGKVIDLLNELDVIRQNEIVLDRLIDCGYQFGLEIPDTIKFENYTLI